MKAIRYYAPQDIRYEYVEVKEPDDNEVLVKIKAALTCGTDIKTYRRGHPVLIKKVPSGFGHELAGIVEKVGKKVIGFEPGDRVVAANSAPCGKCFFCRRQEYNLCENLDLLNGAYAEYITIPQRIVEKNLLKIPTGLSFEKAAFTEPLANVVHKTRSNCWRFWNRANRAYVRKAGKITRRQSYCSGQKSPKT